MDRKFTNSERLLLEALQENAKIHQADLAARAYMSQAGVSRHARELEEEGVILGYHARLDARKVGLQEIAFALVKLTDHETLTLNRFREMVLHEPHVLDCWTLDGESDYILRIAVQNREAYNRLAQDFIDSPFIFHYTTYMISRSIKESHGLPLYHLREG